jgi:hypothetical protein
MLIEVYDATDTTKQGTINTGFGWQISDELNRSGSFSFSMPATDPKTSLIAGKRIVRAYNVIDDLLEEIGAGVIDGRGLEFEQGKNGAELKVSGNDLMRLLTNDSVKFLDVSDGAGGGVTDGIQDILNEASGWSFDTVSFYNVTLGDVFAKFAGELVLDALIKVAEKLGENFRLGDGKEIQWLQTDTPDSGVKAIQYVSPESGTQSNTCLISSLSVEYQAADIVSRVYPFGAGNGEARLNLVTATDPAGAGYTIGGSGNETYIEKDATVSAYGNVERFISFKDIAPISNTDTDIETASNVLLAAAKEYLDKHDDEHVIYGLSVVGLKKRLRPGEIIRVVWRGYTDAGQWVDIDEDLIILNAVSQLSGNNVQTVELTVSNYAMQIKTDQELISKQIGESRIFEAHPQLNANLSNSDFSGTMDNAEDAVAQFWMGAEITTLNQVLLRYRIDPLRSNVKTVAGASTTTPSGGGSTTPSGGASTTPSGGSGTSAAGGATVPTSSTESVGHKHGAAVTGNAIAVNLGLDSGDKLTDGVAGRSIADIGIASNVTNHTHDTTIPNHQHTTPNHTHSTPAHTHTTPNHQHTFTPNLTTTYGIFEESAGNTLAVGNITVKVNGGSDVSGSRVDIGNGWYEIDITDEVQNAATLRPDQENNYVTFGTATAKTATITARISVRSVIQAIAAI